MAAELSTALVGFVRQHIPSIETLEVLLLLHRCPDRAWTAEAVAAELRIQPRSAGARVTALEQAKLLMPDGPGGFRFNAASELLPCVIELAAAYQTHRVRVIELVFSRPAENMRVFADAFLIGRRGRDDA